MLTHVDGKAEKRCFRKFFMNPKRLGSLDNTTLSISILKVNDMPKALKIGLFLAFCLKALFSEQGIIY